LVKLNRALSRDSLIGRSYIEIPMHYNVAVVGKGEENVQTGVTETTGGKVGIDGILDEIDDDLNRALTNLNRLFNTKCTNFLHYFTGETYCAYFNSHIVFVDEYSKGGDYLEQVKRERIIHYNKSIAVITTIRPQEDLFVYNSNALEATKSQNWQNRTFSNDMFPGHHEKSE
jgi:hypothetical protein